MNGTAVRIKAPSFTASVVLVRDHVVRAGEPLREFLGKSSAELRSAIRARGWTATQRPCPAVIVLHERDDWSLS